MPGRTTPAPRRRFRWKIGGLTLLAALALVACAIGVATRSSSPSTHTVADSGRSLPTGPYSKKPNIVFILTDDLSDNLVKYMPHVVALEQTGMTFTNYTVTDSLCCPSRATIFSGKFPHNTHVYTNNPPDGGYEEFHLRGEEKQTFATALESAGYKTAMMGKYLNGYLVGRNIGVNPPEYIPPGWTTWDVGPGSHRDYDYHLNIDGQVKNYGHTAKDYVTDVLGGYANNFVESSAMARKPFFLELATYAPHKPYTPAPADLHSFLNLKAPRGSSFDRIPTGAPRWLSHRSKLSPQLLHDINTVFVKRVEAVQSVDRVIGSIESTLEKTGQLSNTIFVFNSDNGYHLGEHGLGIGKLTAFDTDIKVPLIVSGPGIPAGSVQSDVAENVDLAPTFEQLGGAKTPSTVDGNSLVPLLHGHHPAWRRYALVEHHGPATVPGDPDRQTFTAGNPPTYNAIRTRNFIYVRYVTGAREYYDLRTDPAENHNVVGTLPPSRVHRLNQIMSGLVRCKGSKQCWAAAQPTS
jgi:N-acetylglucosamine-6-sulfatase